MHEDRLAVELKSADAEDASKAADDHLLSIPWQKPPSRKSRRILIPHGIPKNEIRPTRIERRARLVSAIARGRRWLDEIVSGAVTDVQQIVFGLVIMMAATFAALESSGCVMRQPSGVGSSKPLD